MTSNPTPKTNHVDPFDSDAGKRITEARDANPYPYPSDDEETSARCAAWDLYLENARESDSLLTWSATATLDDLIAGAQAWADDYWGEYA